MRLLSSWIWSLAAMRWARVLTTLLMVLRWAMQEAVLVNIGRCLRLVHLASVSVCPPLSAHLSAISLKNSPLCDLILTKRGKRPRSILTPSSSKISRRMSPSGDSFDKLCQIKHREIQIAQHQFNPKTVYKKQRTSSHVT